MAQVPRAPLIQRLIQGRSTLIDHGFIAQARIMIPATVRTNLVVTMECFDALEAVALEIAATLAKPGAKRIRPPTPTAGAVTRLLHLYLPLRDQGGCRAACAAVELRPESMFAHDVTAGVTAGGALQALELSRHGGGGHRVVRKGRRKAFRV